jgi:protein SCO1/2
MFIRNFSFAFTRSFTVAFLPLFIGIASLFSACKPTRQSELTASPDAKRYELTGKVMAVDKAKQEITVAHDEVKGFMPPMTMPFKLKDEWAFADLNAGDMISATLVVDKDAYWLEGIAISKTQSTPNTTVANDQTKTPEQGEAVPDFQLVNQDNKKISLETFKGKYLVLTFIYTRCPLPDQCPLMSNNFAVIHNQMLSDKPLADRVHLLTITFDTKYDTPKVMRSYGASRSGRFDKEDFKLWDFATGTENEIKKTATFFGLIYDSQNERFVHSLRTAIITPDGKIHKVIRGNQWKPDEVIQEIQNLSGNKQ